MNGVEDSTLAPELPVLAFGIALTVCMFAFMLRRHRMAIRVDAAGLGVGGRVIAWSAVRRMCYSRRRGWGGYRVFTDDGVVAFAHEQADAADPDALMNSIVEFARLSPADPLHRPKGFPRHPSDVYEEWAPLAAQLAMEEVAPAKADKGGRAKAGAVGALAILGVVWKFGKFVLLALKYSAKLLKLGKVLPTALTMLLTIGAYAQLWGWRFGVGFVVLILLHELGHAVVIMAKGLRTSPIVFIPFVGAFISIKDQIRDATVEAETAYGGPAAGALASTGCFIIYAASGHAFWLHLAYLGFFMNLFNLLPVSPLDGGRVVTAISTWLWVIGLLLAGAVAWYTLNILLILIVLLGLGRVVSEWQARRKGGTASYYRVSGGYRALMSVAYFGLCGYLGYMVYHVLTLGTAGFPR
ncbi:MAG: site-2 protease family protein [Planctomycetes bacterium]|nr:site-2 protease family protein [Planctomycetota bacterium]